MALPFILENISMHINAIPPLRLPSIGMSSTDARGNLVVPDFSRKDKQNDDFFDRCLAGLLSMHGMFRIYLDHSVPAVSDRLNQNVSLESVLEHFRSNDKMIIHCEVFRLLSVIRDAAASRDSRMTISEKGFYLSHLRGSKETYLKADCEFVEKLLVLAIIMVRMDNRGGEYSLGLLRSIYRDLQQTINLFSNGTNSTLSPLSSEALYLCPNRCRVQQPLFTIHNDMIQIKRLNHSFFDNPSTAPEYFIIFKGRQYVIPDEVLVENEKISVHEVSKWMYNPEILECMRQVKSFITLNTSSTSAAVK